MSSNENSDTTQPGDPATTGHSWDGIEEFNNPLPRWWLWIFYATIIWGVLYTIAYPAWPLVNRATAGVMGFSTRAQVAEEIAAVEARNADLVSALATADLTTLGEHAELQSFATNAGAAVFRAHCSQCHGDGAAGVQAAGYPNLLDDDWLWGGTVDDIVHTVSHGIRNEQSQDARWAEMPAFGDILPREEIEAVVAYVRSIGGREADAALAAAGETVFVDNCAACHGENGGGNQELGAPQLNDAIWLYGGTEAAVTESVMNARFGVMPAWSEEFRPAGGLSQAEINAVAAYVHQLGGGE